MNKASSPQQLVDSAIRAYTLVPGEVTITYGNDNFELAVIKKMELVNNPKDQTPPPKGDFYAYVWTSQSEMQVLKTKLGELAKVGLVVAVSKPVYNRMKSQDLRKARLTVKEFTRHNDKLGFDFSIPNNGYYVSKSNQFKESAYDGFLKTAAAWYNDQSMPLTSKHFADMASKFVMNASQGVATEFSVPDDLKEDRRINGYVQKIDQMSLQLRRAHDEIDDLERENRDAKESIRGSIVLSPYEMADFPQKLRNNVKKMLDILQTTDEKRFLKSLLDPFHPDVLGVRVPTRVPRNTITYNTSSMFNYKATASNSEVLFFNNFEQMSGYSYVAITGPGVTQFLTNTPINLEDIEVAGQEDDKKYDVTVVSIGIKHSLCMDYQKNNTWSSNFFKLRCVAGGTRVLKTSKQDSESGSLDMIYSRDGSSFDEGHSFITDLARSRPDRVRTYLAGAGCCLRATNGFVIQANKRPHDEHSLELLDVKKSSVANRNFAPHGHTSSVWFVDMDTRIMYEPADFHLIPSTSVVGIVLESLQQRHTMISIVQDLQPGMALSFESIYHLEGIADQTAYGFTQACNAKLRTTPTTLQLLDHFEVQKIFSPYSVRRPELLSMLIDDDHIGGFWDETLFPMIQDMIRYGADRLSESDFLDDVIDVVVDAAAGTLGAAAPEFLPAILAAASQVKDPLQHMAHDTLQAATKWADRRDRKPSSIMGNRMSKNAPTMIDTRRPEYGDSVMHSEWEDGNDRPVNGPAIMGNPSPYAPVMIDTSHPAIMGNPSPQALVMTDTNHPCDDAIMYSGFDEDGNAIIDSD